MTRSVDPNPTGATDVVTSYTWDRAGRKTKEVNFGDAVHYDYDRAGNVKKKITARDHAITMRYDALGRLTQRVVPEVFYSEYACGDSGDGGDDGGGGGDGPVEPQFTAMQSSIVEPDALCIEWLDDPSETTMDSLRITPDTATFTYDAMGNQLTAHNKDARVDCTYYPNGWLETDTLRIRDYTQGIVPPADSGGAGGPSCDPDGV